MTLYRTRCCKCQHEFKIKPSLSMQHGHNSGCGSCPKCQQFLHFELLEGDEAWSEEWQAYLARTKYGPGMIEQHTTAEA